MTKEIITTKYTWKYIELWFNDTIYFWSIKSDMFFMKDEIIEALKNIEIK